jgi:ketosteroid isomerase-like protein
MRTPRELVEELVEAYNAKSLERVLALYRHDARFWDPLHPEGVAGRAAIGEVIGGLFESYPDEQMSVVTLVADETHAVAEFRSVGTAASGRPFELELTEVYETSDGQISFCRVYIDTAEIPVQAERGGH